jgi:hypothetical protein
MHLHTLIYVHTHTYIYTRMHAVTGRSKSTCISHMHNNLYALQNIQDDEDMCRNWTYQAPDDVDVETLVKEQRYNEANKFIDRVSGQLPDLRKFIFVDFICVYVCGYDTNTHINERESDQTLE